MPGLIACSHCSQHVLSSETACPHCGAVVRDGAGRVGRTAGALLMGLALAGCGDKSSDDDDTMTSVGEPEYGVGATESYGSEADYGVAETTGLPPGGESSSTTGGEEESGDSSSSGDTGDSSSGGTTGAPMYGLPETTG